MDISRANKTVAIDFDGVLHLHLGEWQGVSKIEPGWPVPGAMHWLAKLVNYARKKGYHVAIYSGRSRSWFGRRAMKKWLAYWLKTILLDEEKAKEIVSYLEFPKHKPLCMVMLDDRVYKFSGTFPRPARLYEYQPWYKKLPSQKERENESDGEDQDEGGNEQMPELQD
jgi:hypothetical protein